MQPSRLCRGATPPKSILSTKRPTSITKTPLQRHPSTTALSRNNVPSRQQSTTTTTLTPLSLTFWKCRHTWSRAMINTTRCLIGCSLGDLSTMYYLMTYHPSMSTAASMGLSMTAGISTSIALETLLLRLGKDALSWSHALKTACGMSLFSMLAMEVTENAVTLSLMGTGAEGGMMSPSQAGFWGVTAVSMAAGWAAPLPWNYWRLRALGKGCH